MAHLPNFFYHHLKHILYLPNIQTIGAKAIDFIPRTAWTVVEFLVGYDNTLHLDLRQMPMLARNDVGGTSTKNLFHWTEMMRTKRFGPFNDETSTVDSDYDLQSLKTNLKDVPLLLFRGKNDFFV
jgi:hypothetical protein